MKKYVVIWWLIFATAADVMSTIAIAALFGDFHLEYEQNPFLQGTSFAVLLGFQAVVTGVIIVCFMASVRRLHICFPQEPVGLSRFLGYLGTGKNVGWLESHWHRPSLRRWAVAAGAVLPFPGTFAHLLAAASNVLQPVLYRFRFNRHTYPFILAIGVLFGVAVGIAWLYIQFKRFNRRVEPTR